MATLAELQGLFSDAGLLPKIEAACIIAAETIRTEVVNTANHSARLVWAKAVFTNPAAVAQGMLKAVLAQNKTLTTVQITGANDAAIQNAVNAAVDLFI